VEGIAAHAAGVARQCSALSARSCAPAEDVVSVERVRGRAGAGEGEGEPAEWRRRRPWRADDEVGGDAQLAASSTAAEEAASSAGDTDANAHIGSEILRCGALRTRRDIPAVARLLNGIMPAGFAGDANAAAYAGVTGRDFAPSHDAERVERPSHEAERVER
jgi:hypothetical protein